MSNEQYHTRGVSKLSKAKRSAFGDAVTVGAIEIPLFTFVQFTDVHVGNPVNTPVHIRLEAAVNLANAIEPAFVIDTGDLTNDPVYEANASNLSEYTEYKKVVSLLEAPLYTIPGNHDIGYPEPKNTTRGDGNPWGEYGELVKAYQKEMGPLDQSFDYKGFRFILANNNPVCTGEPGYLSTKQLGWIEKLLRSGKTTFIFCHVQVLENGTTLPWGDAATSLVALCEKYSVAAVMYGHKHEMHLTDFGGIPYIMCPDLKVPGHQGVFQYSVFRNHFEVWHYDVFEGTGTLAGNFRYPKHRSYKSSLDQIKGIAPQSRKGRKERQ